MAAELKPGIFWNEPRAWRKGSGGWADGQFHYYPDGRKQACGTIWLDAGEKPNEGDSLCPECIEIAKAEFRPLATQT